MSTRSRPPTAPAYTKQHNDEDDLPAPSTTGSHRSFPIMRHLPLTVAQLVLSAASLLYVPATPLLEKPTDALKTTVMVMFVGQIVMEAWRWTLLLDGGRSGDDVGIRSTFTGKVAYMFRERRGHFLTALWITLFAAIMLHMIAILFGAPLFDDVMHTWLFALYVALLAFFPPGVSFGEHSPVWLRVYSGQDPVTVPEKLMFYPTAATLVGAWLGAVVIPLDWERPWQVWPIPCVIGAYIGHALGTILALLACRFGSITEAQRKREQ